VTVVKHARRRVLCRGARGSSPGTAGPTSAPAVPRSGSTPLINAEIDEFVDTATWREKEERLRSAWIEWTPTTRALRLDQGYAPSSGIVRRAIRRLGREEIEFRCDGTSN
jgi:hypothetical protein